MCRLEGVYIKTAGGIMIVLGSFLWGCLRAQLLIERLKRLRLFNQSLLVFETQIDYALMSIPECFEKIGHTYKEQYISCFYLYMSDKLRMDGTHSFETEWIRAVNIYLRDGVLNGQDCEIIEEVGQLPLYLNKNIQLTMLGNVREQMNEKIAAIENECRIRCKIYRIVGLAAGTLVMLLLI